MGISAEHREDLVRRRNELMEKLPDHSIVILKSTDLKVRNNDVEYPYRQNSDFLYLTGLNEPDAYVVLTKKEGEVISTLFCAERTPEEVVWLGPSLGTERAVTTLGFDEAYDVKDLDEHILSMMAGTRHGCIDLKNPDMIAQVNTWKDKARAHSLEQIRKSLEDDTANQLVKLPDSYNDVTKVIRDMRVIKSSFEVDQIAKVCEISSRAHEAMMSQAQPWMNERYLQGVFRGEVVKAGCEGLAYGSICGSGPNACILHYEKNDTMMSDGQMVLNDCGGELEGYAADITRTFPVNGEFSEAQRQLYQVVLEAQKAGIDACRPGMVMKEIQKVVDDALTQGLIGIGLIQESDVPCEPGSRKDHPVARFMPHSYGHWLGLDVHDPCPYFTEEGPVRLEPGMVLTVEPGIYIKEDDASVPVAYRGVGIRIEDVIAVTEGEPRVLSNAIKEVDAVQTFMQSAKDKRLTQSDLLVLNAFRSQEASSRQRAVELDIEAQSARVTLTSGNP